MNLKSTSAITLIALVVTIVVLLILSGVAIITLTGENGILARAQSAKNMTEEATIKENEDLAKMQSDMENIINGEARQGSGSSTRNSRDSS